VVSTPMIESSVKLFDGPFGSVRHKMYLPDVCAGVDSSRDIKQTIMVAADGAGAFAEHCLMAVGHFDQALIYRSMYGAGARASAIQYRGIQVLEVLPLARESDTFRDVRWVAPMDSRLALLARSPS
jgi:hypothetical protein